MPSRIGWLTDIHLNFLPADKLDAFMQELRAARPDGLLIGGDVAEGHNVAEYLQRLAELPVPIYFVLGNHDYYHGSIGAVRRRMAEFCRSHVGCAYLSQMQAPVEIAPGIGLIGHDGWADGRLGDYEQSVISLHDFRLIEDFVGLNKRERWPKLKALGDEAAGHLRRLLKLAAERFSRVLLLTHVPPLREACWHQGKPSDDHWAPFFTCGAVGEAVLDVMRQRPNVRLTVLCGHTHGDGVCRPLPNVEILTGGADYGEPKIQRVFEFD